MKAFIAVTALVIGLAGTMSAASAGERTNDAMLGAGSGFLVGGPIGAVAGGAIGYVAGPDIRRGMGVHHRYHRRVYRNGRYYYQ